MHWFNRLLFLAVFLFAQTADAEGDPTLSGKNEFQPGSYAIDSAGVPLKTILAEIDSKYHVRIFGLDYRENDVVSFHCRKSNIEDLLKCGLRKLKEKNYAFIYGEENLKQVSVLPEAGPILSRDRIPEPGEIKNEEFTTVVEVQKIAEGTQAEHIGLSKGDRIIEYDGVKIKKSSDLVSETKKRSPEEQVEMVIVRDNIPTRYFLNGGKIGVYIRTKKVLKEGVQ